jgi:hypothetical protein
MFARMGLSLVGALLGFIAAPAAAQDAYRCGTPNAVTYSQMPCGGRAVNTKQAPAEPKYPKSVNQRRLEEARLLAAATRLRPGESREDFESRRRRTRLLPNDRAECARLDTRMPVEVETIKNPDNAQVRRAEASLAESRKRFADLHC